MVEKTVANEDLDEIVSDADVVIDDSTQESSDSDQSKSNGSKFVPMIFGGVCAAAIGFGAAQFTDNTSWPFAKGPSEVDGLKLLVEGQSSEIEALQSQLSQIENVLNNPVVDPKFGTLEEGQQGVLQNIGEISGTLSNLNQRLTDLENRPIPEVGATVEAVAAYERELTGMRTMFQAELSRIEDAQTNAISVEEGANSRAVEAEKRAALARLSMVIDSGVPFEDALLNLSAAGIEIPVGLGEFAKSGVATLGSLQSSFPIAARATLNDTIDEEVANGTSGKFGAFLRKQLGTRTLEPKAGDDADAVLSRSEGYLKDGDLAGAISELDQLSEIGKSNMSTWITDAGKRLTTQQFVVDIAANINQ